jgi:hypothetical protein
VPNEYAVWLSPQDRVRYEGIEHEVAEELCAYLLEHARREDLIMASQPRVTFHTDEALALGEFGIQASLVRPPDQPGEAPAPVAGEPPPGAPEHGNTMIYSTSARMRGSLERAGAPARPPRALLAVGSRRLLVPPEGGVLGRSRDCAIVLEDAGVSRHHAELRPDGDGWAIEDLGSTNGVLLNGREIRGASPLREGDRLELGSTEIVFELG